jgi:hypothetical protein
MGSQVTKYITVVLASFSFSAAWAQIGYESEYGQRERVREREVERERVVDREPAADVEDRDVVGGIERQDVDRLQTRIRSRNFNAFSFGPTWFNDLGTDSLFYNLAYAYHWETHPQADIRTEASAALADDASAQVYNLNLGLSWLFTNTEFSPVAGVGLGYAYVNAVEPWIEGGNAFSLNGRLGARLFRTTDTQMEAGARLAVLAGGVSATVTGLYVSILF